MSIIGRIEIARRLALASLAALLLTASAADRSAAADGLMVAKGGDSVPLAEILPEGPAILHFWAIWCVPCREELPDLAEFAAWLDDEGRRDALVVISVDTTDYSRVRSFIEDDLGLGLPSWQVAAGNAGAQFGLFGYPATVLVSANGTIARKLLGPVEWRDEATRQQILEHLAGG